MATQPDWGDFRLCMGGGGVVECIYMKSSGNNHGKGGRPAKFGEPSRPVTVTLPLRILDRLAEIDGDRARAIVKAVETVLGGTQEAPVQPVRELPVSDDETLVAVADNRFLRRISWLTLIEVAPGQHLLSLKDDVPVEKLEVTLCDLLETAADATEAERNVLVRLLDVLRTPRRNRAVRPEAILFIRKNHLPGSRGR